MRTEPKLISLLPTPIGMSAGVIAGIVVAELFYGLILFGVMSGRKREEPGRGFNADAYATVALNPKPAGPDVKTKTNAETKGASPPAPAPAAAATSPKPTPTPTKTAAKPAENPKPSAATKVASGTAPGGPPTKDAAKAGAKPGGDARSVAMLNTASPGGAIPKPAAPQPTPSTAPPAAEPAAATTILGILGALVDPRGDCQAKNEGGAVTITIPPTLHILAPDGKTLDAPRALTPVTGDFTAQVKVSGAIKPGVQPLKGMPFVFQGAGLLLWQDGANYVRLERTVIYTPETGAVHQVLVENCTDGRTGKGAMLKVRDGPTLLRIERRGNVLNCSYSSDGKAWLPLKKFVVPLSPKISVGVSASNAAPRRFDARLEDFTLDRGKGG